MCLSTDLDSAEAEPETLADLSRGPPLPHPAGVCPRRGRRPLWRTLGAYVRTKTPPRDHTGETKLFTRARRAMTQMALGDFAGRHKLMTVFGTSFGVETWQFGIRIAPGAGDQATVSQAQVDALKAPVLAWFTDANAGFPNTTMLQGVKLAPIGVDGHYPGGEVAYIGDITDTTGPINTNIHPAQCAMVMTLVSSALPRGRGSLGRCYLPCPALSIASNGTVGGYTSTAVVSFRTLLNAINAVVDLGTAAIFAREGLKNGVVQPAFFTPVGFCRMDNVVDTQRRRRRSIVGTRSTSAAVVQ